MRLSKLSSALAAAAAAAVSAVPTTAGAIGFGRVVTQTAMGAPLNFVVAVNVDADETYAGDCATAKVEFGDRVITGDRLRVSFESARGSGERRVRVATLAVVDEPVVTVTVSLGCTAQVSKRFVAFADPPVVQLASADDGETTARERDLPARGGDVERRDRTVAGGTSDASGPSPSSGRARSSRSSGASSLAGSSGSTGASSSNAGGWSTLADAERASQRRNGRSASRSAVAAAPAAPVEPQALRRPLREERVAAAAAAAAADPAKRAAPAYRRPRATPAPTVVAGSGQGSPRLRLEATTAGATAAAPSASSTAALASTLAALNSAAAAKAAARLAPPAQSPPPLPPGTAPLPPGTAALPSTPQAATAAAALATAKAPAASSTTAPSASAPPVATAPTSTTPTTTPTAATAAATLPPAAANVAGAAALPPVVDTSTTTAAAASADAVERERVRALEADLAKARSETQAQQQTVATLQARLRQAESNKYANGVVYALAGGILFLALIAAGLWALRPQRKRQAWFDGQAKGKAKAKAKAQASDGAAAQATAPASRPSAAVVEAAAAGAPSTRSPSSLTAELDSGPSLLPRTGSPSTIVGLDVTTVLESQPHHPLTSDEHAADPTTAGAAATRHAAGSMEELIDLEQQAEFFIVLGQDEAAIDLLTAQIGADGGTSPLPYLQLLEIHQRRQDRAAYESVREAFHHRFDAFAPEWTADLHLGRGLDQYPQTIARLQSLWSTPLSAMQTLESLLFRRSASDETFDFPAYRELLFLYSVARELAGNVETDFGAIDLFLPLDQGTPPRPVIASVDLPTEVTVDLDVSAWDMPDPGPALVVRRSVAGGR